MVSNNEQKPLLGKTGPFGSALSSATSNDEARPKSEQLADVDPYDNGRLYIYVMRDPDPRRFPNTLANDDHFTSFFTGREWTGLFLDELKCPVPLPNESPEIYDSKFSAALPGYPMLGRISDMYIYVCYKPEEIGQLREECLRAQGGSSNAKAHEGLTKLVQACDEALKNGSGLLFVPD